MRALDQKPITLTEYEIPWNTKYQKRGLEWQGTLLEAMQVRSKDLSKYTSFKVIACNTLYMLKSTPLSWWYNMRSQQLTTWKDSSYWTEKTIEIDTELPWWPYIPALISNGHSYVHLLTNSFRVFLVFMNIYCSQTFNERTKFFSFRKYKNKDHVMKTYCWMMHKHIWLGSLHESVK